MTKTKIFFSVLTLKSISHYPQLAMFLLPLPSIVFFKNNAVILTALFPLIGSIFLVFFSNLDRILFKKIALIFSFLPLLTTLLIIYNFDRFTGVFQHVTHVTWLPYVNLNVSLGLDGISLFFVLLVSFITPICILLCWDIADHLLKNNLILLLLLEFILINVFCALDVFSFYVFFESSLIPMFLIIGISGTRERKNLASYYFFLYTLLGSVFMLLSLTYIFYQVGTTNYEILLSFRFSFFEQKIMWFAFFLAFASKVPMMPFHLWLPEAHVEAPTAGSVLLAGVLLKLGTYGFMRFSLPLFPQASFYFTPLVYTLAVIGMIYSSLTAMRQTDFKRIIAYTSIAHMNVIVIGVFGHNVLSIEGAILQSLSHGFVASGLFAIIGVVYERHRTRLVKYYGGLVHTMPLFTFLFLFFTAASIGFPGTSGFVGEFMILTGSSKVNFGVTIFCATSLILGSCYSLWLMNRVCFGNLKSQFLKKTKDLSKKEIFIFLPLALYTFILGVMPDMCLIFLHASVNNLIENLYF